MKMRARRNRSARASARAARVALRLCAVFQEAWESAGPALDLSAGIRSVRISPLLNIQCEPSANPASTVPVPAENIQQRST
jgi:hypothetical protein